MQFLFSLLVDLWVSECNALLAVLQHSVWLIDCKSLHRMPRSLVGSRSLNKKELCQCFACKCCLQSLRALFLPKWPHLPGGAASPVFLEEDPNTPCLKQTCCMFGCREKGLQCNGSCTKRTVGGSPRENNVAQPLLWNCSAKGPESYQPNRKPRKTTLFLR